ncbi:MAG: serine/threonine protein kinase [Candidatus Eremiobacteraeota bacterium]|nr:serine/threonine protein kinase [Candidatus Eremiobacteraeota bacterium]MCW5866997.1 serine/threonine protein kinase [Candidatus Eremiobacteraeota bacterium]
MSLEAGDKLGDRYEVVRAITSGGMGSIYEARDLQNGGQRVAVKQLLEHLLEGEQAAMFRTKFEAEVAFLRRLQHPGIPRAYDSFVVGGVYYMVMEFIVGRNLEQELEERMQLTGQPFGVDQIIRDCRQVLDILIYLHSQTPPLLHRDIKPANLIREHPSGRIRLVDFGMARLLSEPNATQTQLGTLGYSPLEQLQGKAEQRSDVYALGASLHHLVTGVVPTVLNIPPVHSLKPDLDPATAAIIDRACSSELNIRFGSAREMLRALDELRPHLPMIMDSPLKLQPLPRLDEPPPPPPAAAPMEPVQDFGEDALPPALELPPPLLKTETETVTVPAVKRPTAQFSLGQQLAAIALLAALAFLFGMGVGNKNDQAASPTPQPSLVPKAETPTAVPISVAPTPTPTPTPVAVAPPPTPRATPKPVAPKPPPPPRPKPPPEEAPESFSLGNTPSYPTAARSGSARETLGLLDKSSHLEINLDADWNPVGRVQSRDYFTRSFRKNTNSYEMELDVKGYTMEASSTTYMRSFEAEHRGWTPIQLAGADLAYSQARGRSQKAQALILRQGHYYWFSLRGNGAGVAGSFPEELKTSWESVSVIDR